MNSINTGFRTLLAAVLLAAPGAVKGAFVVEDFESYAVGTDVGSIGHGWGASIGVVITNANDPGDAGIHAVSMPDNTAISNAVNQSGTTYPRIWTECCLYQPERLDLSLARPAFADCSVMLAVDTNGYMAAYDPAVTNWVEYATDVWGSPVSLASTDWARVSVLHDFSNHTAAVFLNGHLLKSGLSFVTNLSNFGAFRLDSIDETNALLDNVFVSNSIPPSLTNVDLDNDGKPDALEIEEYGNVMTWRRLTNTVTSAGNGVITPLGIFTVISGSNVTYVLAGNETYKIGAVTNNGVVTVIGAKHATYVDSNVTNDRTITVSFVYDGIRYVPWDHVTITGALAVAQAGDTIVVSNASYKGSITLSNGVTLVGTNLGVSATNLTIQGSMSVVTGSVSGAGVLTVTGAVTVATGGLLTIGNTSVNFGEVILGQGASIQVVDGSLTIAGSTRTGTFTIDQSMVVPSILNFTDGFESYPVGTTVNSLGCQGWSASGSGAQVQGTVAVGTVAAMIPANTAVSNMVASGYSNVWAEMYLNCDVLMDPVEQPLVDTNRAVMLFFGTNGYLTVYNPALSGWDVCSNDAWNGSVARMSTGQWVRVNVYQNYSNRTAAIFLDDHLLRQQVPLISAALIEFHGFRLDGATYLDGVRLWTNPPPDLAGDVNYNGRADAYEINAFGQTIDRLPAGSIYTIR